jgi:ferredoxin--NADP+ reductase
MISIAEPETRTANPDAAVKWTTERVTWIHYWTPTLLSFRTTRYRAFRFTPGHYARLGLGPADDPVWRPYSLVSAHYDDYLEFVAVLVPGGAFSEQLAKLRVGDEIAVEKACFGFLTTAQLAPGRDLWMLASGTGLGPFISILRDPAQWTAFERLIVVHSVRHGTELTYRDEIAALSNEAMFADARAKLSYLPVVTRDDGATELGDRIPRLLADGRLEKQAQAPISAAYSRVMVCGNPEMARELRELLATRGFATSRRGAPGQMAFEKYW